MKRLLCSIGLRRNAPRRSSTRRNPRARLRLEWLEDRRLLSGVVTVQTDTADTDNDGTVDAITTLTQEFDNNDNLIRQVFAADDHADGTADFSESYAAELDRLENLIREV